MNTVAKSKRTCRDCTVRKDEAAVKQKMIERLDANVYRLPFVTVTATGHIISTDEIRRRCPAFRGRPETGARDYDIKCAEDLTANVEAAQRAGITADDPALFSILMRYLKLPRQLGEHLVNYQYYTIDKVLAMPVIQWHNRCDLDSSGC